MTTSRRRNDAKEGEKKILIGEEDKGETQVYTALQSAPQFCVDSTQLLQKS